MNLTWSIPESNGCPLIMYRIYYRERQSGDKEDFWYQINATVDSRSLHLTSLKCNAEYAFRVSSWNEVGESDMSPAWSIKTIEGTI